MNTVGVILALYEIITSELQIGELTASTLLAHALQATPITSNVDGLLQQYEAKAPVLPGEAPWGLPDNQITYILFAVSVQAYMLSLRKIHSWRRSVQ
jgi:hypothetical protein